MWQDRAEAGPGLCQLSYQSLHVAPTTGAAVKVIHSFFFHLFLVTFWFFWGLRLPREAVAASSLAVFKVRLDVALNNLL